MSFDVFNPAAGFGGGNGTVAAGESDNGGGTVPIPQVVLESAYSDRALDKDYATVEKGESISVRGKLTPSAGELKLTAAPTWRVYHDGYGGYSPETCTVYTQDPAATVEAVADVDTGQLDVGNYKVVFVMTYLGADTKTHVRHVEFKLFIQPAA